MNSIPIEDNLYTLPLWLIALLTLLGLALALVAGRLLNRAWRRRFGTADVDSPVLNFILSASLGLLSLLMGFTFSMAASNYAQRRAMVVDEANAVTSVYLLSQTFGEADRHRMANILTTYVDTRLALAASRDPAERLDLLRRSEGLQARIWAAAMIAARDRENPVRAIFLNNTQRAFNTGSTRDATRLGHHIPARVSAFLIIYMLMTATALGFQTTTWKPLVMGSVLLLVLTMSTVLILDLDRPNEGAILESQAPMFRVQKRLATGTPDALQRLVDELAGAGSARPGPPPGLEGDLESDDE